MSIPAFTLIVRNLSLRRAFGLGYLCGLGMLTVAVSWVYVLGLWVAALLIVFEALFFGVLGVLLSLMSRLRWWPVAAAAAWVLVEYAYAPRSVRRLRVDPARLRGRRHPLGGFLPVIGDAGLSFVVALVAQIIAWCAHALWSMRTAPAGLPLARVGSCSRPRRSSPWWRFRRACGSIRSSRSRRRPGRSTSESCKATFPAAASRPWGGPGR